MSSKVVDVASTAQLQSLIESTEAVFVAFYRSNAVLSTTLELFAQNAPGTAAFAKCNSSKHQDISARYNVTIDPTLLMFRSGALQRRIEGEEQLRQQLQKLFGDAAGETGGSSSGAGAADSEGSSGWLGAALPKGFKDVTGNIELVGLDIMNATGSVRTLFEDAKPSSIGNGKGKESDSKDWIESDTDEQLMLFIPFQGQCRVHSLQITSFASVDEDEDDDEVPSRPRTVNIYVNTPQILGFDEASGREPTQRIVLEPKDWDAKTGTATLNTRFVKFQNVSSFTIFISDVERTGAEKVRVDRIRVIGEKLHEKVNAHAWKQSLNDKE